MPPRKVALKQAIDDLEHAQASLEAAIGALIRGGASAVVTKVDHAFGQLDEARQDAERAMQRAG
jgi:exonuclease VII small subunit